MVDFSKHLKQKPASMPLIAPMMPLLAFPTPQFDLVPDNAGSRFYANVDNRMEVNNGGRVHHVNVAVPALLFSIMRDVFNVPIEEDVKLSIDRYGMENGRFVFSIFYADELRDLWDYSPASLPVWINHPDFKIGARAGH